MFRLVIVFLLGASRWSCALAWHTKSEQYDISRLLVEDIAMDSTALVLIQTGDTKAKVNKKCNMAAVFGDDRKLWPSTVSEAKDIVQAYCENRVTLCTGAIDKHFKNHYVLGDADSFTMTESFCKDSLQLFKDNAISSHLPSSAHMTGKGAGGSQEDVKSEIELALMGGAVGAAAHFPVNSTIVEDENFIESCVDVALSAFWIIMVVMIPFALTWISGNEMTLVQLVQAIMLAFWALSAVILWTNVVYFNSDRYEGSRHLTLIESVYLLSQIITTVGYGDFTPAFAGGQLLIAFHVMLSLLIVSVLLSEVVSIVIGSLAVKKEKSNIDRSHVMLALDQVSRALCVHGGLVTVWCMFFCIVESKTIWESIYFSIITLSTVGFGAITPETHVGMIFVAYVSIIGGASLANLVSQVGCLTQELRKAVIKGSGV
mmetsp:Transcript_62300/g.133980  ORF Transcript_62300/g.133980 Transcript_62300/m.133980 type:complete len:430 (+) Transcript_62300:75-1364(+)